MMKEETDLTRFFLVLTSIFLLCDQIFFSFAEI